MGDLEPIIPSDKSIQEYLKEGKTLHQDFIPSSENPHHTVALICSFANSEGGILIVGVNPKGKVIGVLPDAEEENIRFVVQHYCTSQIELRFSKQTYQSKYVLLIDIPKILNRTIAALSVNATPHYFVRSVTGEVFEANKIIEKAWVIEKKDIDQYVLSNEAILICSSLKKQTLTISQIYKSLDLKKSLIDSLLSVLISKNIVYYDFENQYIVYGLV
jgi:predicted HTH transcriptional regulator